MKLTRRRFISLLGTASLATLAGGYKIFGAGQPEIEKMTIAYPPTMAALPLVKGTQEANFMSNDGGHFHKNGVKLSLRATKGSSEAVRLVSGGLADCCITDLSSSIYGITGTGNISVTSTIFDPNNTDQYYGLLSSKFYEVTSLEDLVANWLDGTERKSIVLATRRDVQYATDKLLTDNGFEVDEKSFYLDREDLISRMTGLLNGNYISAVLPEPLLTLALENPEFEGYQANLIDNYNGVTLPPFVMVFNDDLIENRPETAGNFYRGWRESVKSTNESNKLQLLGLSLQIISTTLPQVGRIIEQMDLGQSFADLFNVPTFELPGSPNKKTYESVVSWAVSHKFLSRSIAYDDVVDSSLDI
ncbi:MAG: ABC transporter substrate-binding protein [Candidatus Bipolaricaulota bacterium]